MVLYGRSDATLNRSGVRIGTAEIYRTLGRLAEIEDAIAVHVEQPQYSSFLLFVALRGDAVLDESLRQRIAATLRAENSPRHVPDEIIAVPAILYTMSGKRMEVPLRLMLGGADPDTVASRESASDPSTFDWFAAFAARRHAGPPIGSTEPIRRPLVGGEG